MLISVAVTVEELSKEGRNFKWERPICPCGCKKVWKHGFVARFFDKLSLDLQRFRCPKCLKVFTLMPSGFWRNCQSSAKVIIESLVERLKRKRWPTDVPRQRGGFWLSRFQAYAYAFFPDKDQLQILQAPLELRTCFRI